MGGVGKEERINGTTMTGSSFDKMLEGEKKQRRHPGDAEHRLQCACVRWFRLQHPGLRHALFAIPNGGRRDKATGARLKEEGVVAGVADLILLHANCEHHALLIEMKAGKGRQSQSQKEWQQMISADGYKYVVCRSLEEFVAEVNGYLNEAESRK